MSNHKSPKLKPRFVERMRALLGEDYENYEEILRSPPVKSLRCNKIKISPEKLKKRLEEKGWRIKQPWKNYPEVMIVESELEPGEFGRSLEHLLGYYYIQELASMLPPIALSPKPNEIILDLCSSPGSKTTQIASEMENTGTIIANEVSFGRIKILASNLERCGVTNAIVTKKEGNALCAKLNAQNFKADKILVDAPCSGEGTLRSSPKTEIMWNPNTIISLSKLQKQMLLSAWNLLKIGGELVYSTCTHAPEENEEVVDFFLRKFKEKIKIEKLSLPVKFREGICKWKDKKYLPEVRLACRIYPQDNNTEGFFLAKFKKLK